MIFIGDIHGYFETYFWLLKHKEYCSSFQVGDFGLGFHQKTDKYVSQELDKLNAEKEIAKFIRGNHDDPEVCNSLDCCLGDYGYHEKNDIFYYGGGLSIDKPHRTPMVNWWPDEQISHSEAQKALELYKESKPEIVVSHECPEMMIEKLGDPRFESLAASAGRSHTSVYLQSMFDIHKPSIWICGHYHKRLSTSIQGVEFEALDMIPASMDKGWIDRVVFEIPELEW